MELTSAAELHLKPKLQEKEFPIEKVKIRNIDNVKSIQVESNVVENIKEYGDCPEMNKIEKAKQEHPQSSSTNALELRSGCKHSPTNFPMSKREKKSGFYKILKWDAWQKNSNKKKKNKKKTDEESVMECIDVQEAPRYYYPNIKFYPPIPVPQTCGLKLEEPNVNQDDEDDNSLESYNEYTKNKLSKTVKFQNEVVVLHFANDELVDQSIEPLKKGLEQQERNKKLRNDVNNPETFTGVRNSKCKGTSYMSHWFKK